MKLYAVETTNRMQLCGINARNIVVYRNLNKAKDKALVVALANNKGKVRSSNNIAYDNFLDKTMAVFDTNEGTAETAEALAYITEINTY